MKTLLDSANMLRKIARGLKNVISPKGSAFRRLPFGPAAGAVMKIDFRHHATLYLGQYERELATYFRRLLKRNFRCYDVGGQSGYDALLMAMATGAEVVTFECDHSAAEELRDTVSRNRLAITVVEAFVGDRDARGRVTLDSATRTTFTPDFIKIDVEGAEDAVLRGASRILSERKPAMIVEVHGMVQEEACRKILLDYGYSIEVVNQRRWGKENRPIAHNRWLVCS